METSEALPRTRHRGACINCRQQKARCDAFERLPSPCSRCEKAGKECIIDRAFKRTTRRDRLDELEKEIHGLRQNLSQPTAPGSSTDVDRLVDPGPSQVPSTRGSNPTSLAHDVELVSTSRASLLPEPTEAGLSPQQLEGVILQPHEIMEHIVLFYRYYHESLPILPSLPVLLEHIQSCQLLLWAIIVITSTHIESRKHLEVELVDAIRRLVATEFLVSEATSIFQVQALLILAYWPLPFKATIQDPSWLYSNMALSKGLRIGLHRSGSFFQFMYGPQGGEKMRLRTWVACFIIVQQYAAALGLPATIRLDNIILKCVAERPPDLPLTLHRMLIFTYKIHVFTEQLGDHEFTADGLMPEPLPLVQVFDRDVRGLGDATDTEKLMKSVARLYLYSFILAAPPPADQSAPNLAPVQTHHGVFYVGQTYSCAKQIVDMFEARTKLTSTPEAPDRMHNPRLWTGFERWSVVYATMTILWIIKLSGIDNNNNAAQAVVDTGRSILKRLILTPEDHYSRVCDIIDYISAMDPSSSEGRIMSHNVVRARMSVNIIWDVVYAAKQRFRERRKTSGSTVNDYCHTISPKNHEEAAPSAAPDEMLSGQDFGATDALFMDWDSFIPDLDQLDSGMSGNETQW